MGPPIFIGGNFILGGISNKFFSASMGPPIFIGGNFNRTVFRLEYLPSFNGAADFHRRKSGKAGGAHCPCAKLQWGRRFSSAEINGARVMHFLMLRASMGPPIFIGGNVTNNVLLI